MQIDFHFRSTSVEILQLVHWYGTCTHVIGEAKHAFPWKRDQADPGSNLNSLYYIYCLQQPRSDHVLLASSIGQLRE